MSAAINGDMSEFWNGEGGRKWLAFQESMDVSLLPFGQNAMTAAAISRGESVLDVGCGCGNTSIEMARLVGVNGRVLGIDISESILARAKAQAISAGRTNIAFECGDAQTRRFVMAEFNVIFSRFGVMFFDDPVAAFGNFYHALKPGGRTAFVCWRPATDNEWVNVSLEIVARHVSLPAPPGPEDPGPMSFGDPERVSRILSSSGFSDIRISNSDASFTIARNLDEAVSFLMQMGPAGGAIAQSDAHETTKTEIAKDMYDALLPYDAGSGVIMGAATSIVTAQKQ